MLKLDLSVLTTEQVKKLIQSHETRAGWYAKLNNYYQGYQDILGRSNVPNKPNNKLVHNYPGYITDVNVGYFLGIPIAYTQSHTDKPSDTQQELGVDIENQPDLLIDVLQDIYNYNDEQAHNANLGKDASINGHAFELLYIDGESRVRFSAVKPAKIIMIYTNTVEPEPKMALRYWYEQGLDGEYTKNIHLEIYTDKEITEYKGTLESLTEVSRRTHPFKGVPVVEYLNNDERQGDFEKVLTLIDAYDNSRSNTQDDEDDFTDAFLKIINMSGTQGSDVANMKRDKVILCDGDGDADWLTKQVNDSARENNRKALQEDIHKFSSTPNITDDSFASNASGVAIKYKLFILETSTSQKERLFKKALQRRIELICNYLEVLQNKKFDYRDIDMVFSRNLPVSLEEKTKVVESLDGRVSRETLLSLLPFVEDPAAEMEKLNAERGGEIDIETVEIGDDE